MGAVTTIIRGGAVAEVGVDITLTLEATGVRGVTTNSEEVETSLIEKLFNKLEWCSKSVIVENV